MTFIKNWRQAMAYDRHDEPKRWQEIAVLASSEYDDAKLMQLVTDLIETLDQEARPSKHALPQPI